MVSYMACRGANPVCVLTIMLGLCAPAWPANYGGGAGTADDPYQIWTPEQMNAIGADPNDWDKHFKLMADIDLSTFDGTNGRQSFNIIAPDIKEGDHGFTGAPFQGTFDGCGHTISHLTATGLAYIGLFGRSAPSARIIDLELSDVNVTGSGSFIGALVGDNRGEITDCHTGGTVTGGWIVGGLVGNNFSSIGVNRCYSTAAVKGNGTVGGLAGENGGSMSHCHSRGIVSGLDHTGGLVGRDTGTLSWCSSAAMTIGTKYVGGLAGSADDYVAYCSSTGPVSGGETIGGLIGSSVGCVTLCYSTGEVHGEKTDIGGLVGYTQGTIIRCYSAGPVSGDGNTGGFIGNNRGILIQCYSIGPVRSRGHAGGFAGSSERPESAAGCFWDTETSGIIVSPAGTGLTTSRMQEVEPYRDAGWDWLGWREDGTSDVWQMPKGGGYPVLAVLNGCTPSQLQGEGSFEAPYLISNAEELGAVVYYSPSAHYRLTAPIDLSGICWAAAVIPWFSGTFDGGGFTISQLAVRGESYVGLFGQIGWGGEVRDLSLVDVNVIGSGNFVGGLAGTCATATRCHTTGSVSADGSYVGGLLGMGGGSVVQSYSTCTVVAGGSHTGGLLGYSSGGNVTHCYSEGAVTGGKKVGGLVGSNGTLTSYCYSIGRVVGADSDIGGLVGFNSRDVLNCFWDLQTSGCGTSAGGVGKTTSEMQMSDTFLTWATCGNEGTWTIDDSNDYPHLSWENRPGAVLQTIRLSDVLAGVGTLEDPFLIYTGNELALIGMFPCEWDKHFKLMADVDLSAYTGAMFNIIGAYDRPFAGVFDGNCHTISHLTYASDGRSPVGLFGVVTGSIKNLGLIDPNVDGGTRGYVGALAGYLWGTISGCYVKGGHICGKSAAGLVGCNNGAVTCCYSMTAVESEGTAAGLILGTNSNAYRPLVRHCYSACPTAGHPGLGLIGWDDSGRRIVAGCFWDTQASGCPWSTAGTGKTTVEMQTAKTFLDAGWDFVGETASGTEDLWWIEEGKGYPRLWWEAATGEIPSSNLGIRSELE